MATHIFVCPLEESTQRETTLKRKQWNHNTTNH